MSVAPGVVSVATDMLTEPFPPVSREEAFGMDADKEKQIGLALAQIEKAYGKGAVMRLGDHAQRLTVEAIPTGSLALDIALGVGGLSRRRRMELFGPGGTGKATVSPPRIAG